MAREHLIAAAVSFLSSDKVRDHPDETKRNFLLEKGLSNDEVVAAFARSRAHPPKKDTVNYNQLMDECIRETGSAVNISKPVRPAPPLILVAAFSTAAIAIVVYLYKVFRQYVWPWIVRQWRSAMGGKKKEAEEEAGSEMKEIVTSQVYELHDTISTIKCALDKQQNQIREIASKNPGAVEELRKELESVKRLLLSAESFPQPKPSQLPSWQIRKSPAAAAAVDSPAEVKVPEVPSVAGDDITSDSEESELPELEEIDKLEAEEEEEEEEGSGKPLYSNHFDD